MGTSAAEDPNLPLTNGVALWVLRAFVAEHKDELQGEQEVFRRPGCLETARTNFCVAAG